MSTDFNATSIISFRTDFCVVFIRGRSLHGINPFSGDTLFLRMASAECLICKHGTVLGKQRGGSCGAAPLFWAWASSSRGKHSDSLDKWQQKMRELGKSREPQLDKQGGCGTQLLWIAGLSPGAATSHATSCSFVPICVSSLLLWLFPTSEVGQGGVMQE